MNLFVILMLIAVICFGLSAAGVATRVNLTALGLAFMAGAFALNVVLIT